MAYTNAITTSITQSLTGTNVVQGTSLISETQTDTEGKSFSGTLSTLGNADLDYGTTSNLGGIEFATGTTYYWLWITNLDDTNNILISKDAADAENIGTVRPGESWGPSLIDFGFYLRNSSGAATAASCKVVAIQE